MLKIGNGTIWKFLKSWPGPPSQEDHVCMVCDDCIGISKGVVQKMSYLFCSVLSQVCLLCGDLLDVFFVLLGEQCWRVRVFHMLCLCSVVGFDMRVWLMLRLVGCLVLESREGLGDLVKHWDVDPVVGGLVERLPTKYFGGGGRPNFLYDSSLKITQKNRQSVGVYRVM